LIRKYRHNEAVNVSQVSIAIKSIWIQETRLRREFRVQSRSSWWLIRGFTPWSTSNAQKRPPPSKTAQTSPLVLSPLLHKNAQGKPFCSPSSSGVQDQFDSFQDPHEFIDILDTICLYRTSRMHIGPALEFEERDDEDGREGGSWLMCLIRDVVTLGTFERSRGVNMSNLALSRVIGTAAVQGRSVRGSVRGRTRGRRNHDTR
jgi:hypothetical protein